MVVDVKSSSVNSNWVNELDDFRSESTLDARPVLPASSKSMMKSKSRSQVEELQQEMKLLQWHKLANEAALKAALIKTKKMKRDDIHSQRQLESEERAEWRQQVMKEEESKPMMVCSDFLRKFEEEKQRTELRQESELQRHITSLEMLKKTLKERDSQRLRQAQFKDGMQQLKQGTIPKGIVPADGNKNQQDDQNKDKLAYEASLQSTPAAGMNHVMHSLDKLVDLEKRITTLENDQVATSSTVKFTKKRSETKPKVPSKTFYAVKVVKRATRNPVRKVATVRSKPIIPRTNTRTSRNAIPANKPKNAVRSRGRVSTHRMSDRQRRTVTKLDAKQTRLRETKRQDVVIKDWLHKKKQPRVIPKVTAVKRVVRGAASGKTTNNRHMQQFNDLKRQMEKRKTQPTRSTNTSRGGSFVRMKNNSTTLPKITRKSLSNPPKSKKPAIPTTRRKRDPLPEIRLGISGTKKI